METTNDGGKSAKAMIMLDKERIDKISALEKENNDLRKEIERLRGLLNKMPQ